MSQAKNGLCTLNIGCIVLVGGKCCRLGRDKALEVVGDRSLLERVLSSLSPLESNIILVAAKNYHFPQLNGYPGLRKVTDTYPDKGPLGGIYTGLETSSSFYNLIVACDMPFLNWALLGYMIELSSGYDLVVPRLGSLVEPLHAVYSKCCLAPMESLLKQGELNISNLFNLVKVRYVEADEIDRFDPNHLSFFNVNTEADLETAEGLVKGS